MDKYLKAIKQNVCSICVDSDENGRCKLNTEENCAVEFYLPQILEIVVNSKSEDTRQLQSELHEKVCINCISEGDGNCYLREDANCALDRYFSLIVETIRKTSKENG